MAFLESSMLVWALGFVQVLGLVSAWLARQSEGSESLQACHALFYCCLTLVGLSMLLAMALGPAYWLTSGATLAIMVLAAIWDFHPHAHQQVEQGW